jgi:hypothetical protein
VSYKIGLTESPEGATFLSGLFGANGETDWKNGAQATVSGVDFNKNLFQIVGSCLNGKKFSFVWDMANLVVVQIQATVDSIQATADSNNAFEDSGSKDEYEDASK